MHQRNSTLALLADLRSADPWPRVDILHQDVNLLSVKFEVKEGTGSVLNKTTNES